MTMLRLTRRSALTAAVALILAACGSSNGEDAATPAGSAGDTIADAAQDIILGDPNAAVTIIEYASWTCPHCKQFHEDVMPMIQRDYIDTGKVRFVFREFPTPPADLAVAGFAIARCAGDDKYYDVIDELFERQPAILTMARQGGPQIKAALVQIAENNGMDGEVALDACLADREVIQKISVSVSRGDAAGVNATPTLFVNNQLLEGYDWRYADGMKTILDDALGIPADDEVAESDDATVSEETTSD